MPDRRIGRCLIRFESSLSDTQAVRIVNDEGGDGWWLFEENRERRRFDCLEDAIEEALALTHVVSDDELPF